MITHITYAEDEVGSKLMLDLQTPVLNHAGAAIFRGYVIGKSTVQERRILCIGRQGKTRKTCIQQLHRTKAILRLEVRIGCGTASQRVPKIRVAQSRVIDSISTSKDGVSKMAKEALGCISKTKAWRKILVVGVGTLCIRTVNRCTGHCWRNRNGG